MPFAGCFAAVLLLFAAGSARADRAYVVSETTEAAGVVSIVNAQTGAIEGTLPLDGTPTWSAPAFTPNGRYAYLPVESPSGPSSRGVVDVIRTRGPKIIARIGIGQWPYGVAISPNGRYAYVSSGSQPEVRGPQLLKTGDFSGAVTIIDVATRKVVARVAVPFGSSDVSVSPEGRFAYVGGVRIDTETRRVVLDIPSGSDLPELPVSPPLEFDAKGLAYGFPNSPYALGRSLNPEKYAVYNTRKKRLVGEVPVLDELHQQLPTYEGVIYSGAGTLPRCGGFATTSDGAYTFLLAGYTSRWQKVVENGREEWEEIEPHGVIAIVSNPERRIVGTILYGHEGAGCGSLEFAPRETSGAASALKARSIDTGHAGPMAGVLYVPDGQGHVAAIDTVTRQPLALWQNPSGTTAVPEPVVPPCHASLLARLKCAYARAKDIVSCGLALAELPGWEGLGAIKAIKGLYDLKKVKKALRPIYALYNDIKSLKFKDGMTAAKMWNVIKGAHTVAEVLHLAIVEIEAGVDLRDRHFKQFVRDFAELIGIDGCVALYFGPA